MSPSLCLLTVTLVCSLHPRSTAQPTDRLPLTPSPTASTTGSSTLRTSTRASENVSATMDQTDSAVPSNATVPLDGFSPARSEAPPDDGGHTAPSAGETGAPETGTTCAPRSVSPTTEPRPTVASHGPNKTQASTAPSGPAGAASKLPAVPTAARSDTPPSTVHVTAHTSRKPSAIPGQKNSELDEKREPGRTLGVFIGLAVVLLLVLALIYLIYNKTQKDDAFSHQRLYDNDPVLSLDVSVEPADRFYGGLTTERGCEGRGDHATSQRALSQAAGEVGEPARQPQARDEIQLKPMSESSVKIFL